MNIRLLQKSVCASVPGFVSANMIGQSLSAINAKAGRSWNILEDRKREEDVERCER